MYVRIRIRPNLTEEAKDTSIVHPYQLISATWYQYAFLYVPYRYLVDASTNKDTAFAPGLTSATEIISFGYGSLDL